MKNKTGAKTYKRGSKHNIYRPDTMTHNIRIDIELRLKLEKAAAIRGMTLNEFTRFAISEAVRDVRLTSEDAFEIARRMQVNEERNKERVERCERGNQD